MRIDRDHHCPPAEKAVAVFPCRQQKIVCPACGNFLRSVKIILQVLRQQEISG